MRTEVGALERAHGGTLYLSEVAALPAPAQAALLRTLVENKFNRVGGTVAVPIDVRIIAGSSQNVAAADRRRRQFRSDLFHRLSIVPLQLTPLKERREDVPPLVDALPRSDRAACTICKSLTIGAGCDRGAAGAGLARQCAPAAQFDRAAADPHQGLRRPRTA